MNDETNLHALPPLDAGVACTDLLVEPGSWINRRVETIEMLSYEETRRRVSVDFTLANEQLDRLHIADGVVAPISLLTKEPRRNFDLRDESGRSIPVLGKHQNGELARIALVNASLEALGEIPDDVPSEMLEFIAADLREVVQAPSSRAAKTLGSFIGRAESGDGWRAAVWNDAKCRALLEALWSNYVLFAVLTPDTANRRVLKYSYGEDFDLDLDRGPLRKRFGTREIARRAAWPDRSQFLIECPGAWRAMSFHVEIAIPEELRFELAVLVDVDDWELRSAVDTDVNRAALYAAREIVDGESVAAFVEVAAERAGRPIQFASTSLLVASLLWLGAASGLDAENPGAAVSILLAGAALFSGLAVAQGEHRLVKSVFSAARRWLALVTVLSLSGSASLAMEIPDERPVYVWLAAAILASIAAVRLTWSAFRAPA